MTRIRIRRSGGLLSKNQVDKEIIKRRLDLKSLERISELQKRFQVSQITKGSRSTLKRKIEKSKFITTAAKKKLKLFKIQTPRGIRFVAAVPKGIKIKIKRK